MPAPDIGDDSGASESQYKALDKDVMFMISTLNVSFIDMLS